MASYDVEVAFVGIFSLHASNGDKSAWDAMTVVRPEMLEDGGLRAWYGLFADRFSAGRDLMDPDDKPNQALLHVIDEQIGGRDLSGYAERVRDHWRAREQARLLSLAVVEANKSIDNSIRARLVSERISTKLLELFSEARGSGPTSLPEMADAEIAAIGQQSDPGIRVPFPKLHDECGPLMPGDVMGITAYSGGGKSTLAANLLRGWLLFGSPVIAFPTEMRERWLARAGCAMSGVPQWIAEKRQWSQASQDQKDAYRDIMEMVKGKRFEIVNRPNVSPAEIIAATRVIRKRWSGPAIVIVDHMHRLDYGSESSNDAVGSATKLLKNFASDEGLVFVLLFQPRKPPQGDVNRPTAAFEIRGDSTVWNELDIHISPFRPWLRTDEGLTTKWGTPKALLDMHGAPVIGRAPIPGKPPKDPCHVTDEYVFIKVDKRRVGGEGGTLWFNFDKPSGAVMENAA